MSTASSIAFPTHATFPSSVAGAKDCKSEGSQCVSFTLGDMTTPAISKGDLLLVTAGPGMLSTALALVGVAKMAGARVLTITAEPEGPVPKMSDEILVLPAQTMANDQGENVSILPMGSVYEGALFVLFEVIILKLKTSLKVTDEVMRSNHTNLE
jgi:6-phospho-3-hexuloisomerase